ncbi:unnamed protein product [Jaminaea pallidilutea]
MDVTESAKLSLLIAYKHINDNAVRPLAEIDPMAVFRQAMQNDGHHDGDGDGDGDDDNGDDGKDNHGHNTDIRHGNAEAVVLATADQVAQGTSNGEDLTTRKASTFEQSGRLHPAAYLDTTAGTVQDMALSASGTLGSPGKCVTVVTSRPPQAARDKKDDTAEVYNDGTVSALEHMDQSHRSSPPRYAELKEHEDSAKQEHQDHRGTREW